MAMPFYVHLASSDFSPCLLSDMPNVLIFKETLLPKSETFILAQMRALTTFTPKLSGLEYVQPSLPLTDDEPVVMSKRTGRLASLRAKVYRRVGVAPYFHNRLRRFQPDLVHAHFASGGRAALPLARSLGVPLIVTLHGADVTVRQTSVDTYKRLGDEAKLFLCVSKFIRDRAIDIGLPAEKLRVHYIGVDRSQFVLTDSNQESKQILFVGRLVEKKGCEYLLRAMALVQRDSPACELTVIGDGPLRTELEALAARLRLRCRFLGTQPAEMIRKALRRTRLFCVPSVTAANGDSEGLGIVFAEAQAAGIPVVSTRHGGIPEVVWDENSGLLTPERDHRTLAAALSRLLADPALWQRFHNAALLHIDRNFNLATQTALLEEMYAELIA